MAEDPIDEANREQERQEKLRQVQLREAELLQEQIVADLSAVDAASVAFANGANNIKALGEIDGMYRYSMAGMTSSLIGYQVIGTARMITQELDSEERGGLPKGGLLSDAMGLGSKFSAQ